MQLNANMAREPTMNIAMIQDVYDWRRLNVAKPTGTRDVTTHTAQNHRFIDVA